MVLIVDNYDSFTYNLAQVFGALGVKVVVLRNDALPAAALAAMAPDHVVLSPGPGRPSEAGVTGDLINLLAGKVPILGVCLGHQAIGEAFGGVVSRAPEPVHGKLCEVHHDGRGLFRGVPSPFRVVRYHSLVVQRNAVPKGLEVSAWTGDGLVMGLRHRTLPALEGVQFHPESIATEHGQRLIANFIEHDVHPLAA